MMDVPGIETTKEGVNCADRKLHLSRNGALFMTERWLLLEEIGGFTEGETSGHRRSGSAACEGSSHSAMIGAAESTYVLVTRDASFARVAPQSRGRTYLWKGRGGMKYQPELLYGIDVCVLERTKGLHFSYWSSCRWLQGHTTSLSRAPR